MADVNRERDLVLAPNEYAYISDQTKGHVIAYVGPYKTSLANTDKPVTFDETSKRFKLCNLEEAIVNFATAPEGWYIILKNPSKDGNQPKIGTSNNLPELEIGRKVNLPGPVFFALWPGQMARIVPGHHLRSNQYLLVRVYDEEQARKNWNKAVIKVKNEEGEEISTRPDMPDLTMGQQLVIKGTNVSFYIPPTGVEVVRDASGNYVREAVTLERLEYCILLDESGNKRYIIGPDVVFPNPTETFITKDGSRKFKAIELNEISGIYVKVIAPYEEDGKKYNIGDELFITGKDQMIYYPRVEHALIKYGEQEIYHAVAIPAGQGRYVLNRKTGKINLVKGPTMLLPDPREFVLVRRILSTKQVELCYPGNKEAMQYNLMLSQMASEEQQEYLPAQRAEQKREILAKAQPSAPPAFATGDEFTRSQKYSPPRMITLTDKYDGAVTVNIWAGYASLVVSKTGERKVISGPNTYLLEYDEELQPIEFSTGTPKTDANTIRTVYLRVLHNKVSDLVVVETKDFCQLEIKVSYRMNFTGEPEKWFDVENYVKFLTDHMRSVLANAVQKLTVTDFYFNSIAHLRDIVLGPAGENGRRAGRKFEENGMHIYDLEVLDITILDTDIQDAILESQHEGIQEQIQLTRALQGKSFTDEKEEIDRHVSRTRSITKQMMAELMLEELHKNHKLAIAKIQAAQIEGVENLKSKLSEQDFLKQIQESELARKKAEQEAQLAFNDKILEQKLRELQAEVDASVAKAGAFSPDLIAALQAFGDKALAEKMAESMAPLSILGGKSVAEVFANLLKGTNLENVLKLGGKE
jgi:major vault protein